MMNLVEIFSSVQGEGLTIGERTLFVRFGECDLRCTWCDSVHTWRPAERCRIETSAGSGLFEERENPISADDVGAALEGLGIGRHRWISFTGGEPLLQPAAVLELAGKLRGRGPGLHLETHGAAPEALEQVVDVIDLVSMDWKLASDVRREKGVASDFHDVHERFLRVARRAPRVVVKLVLTPNSGDAELAEAFDRIAAVAPETPVVLQPVTPCGAIDEAPPAARLLAILAVAEERLGDVRLIPQTHPLLGVA